MIARFVLSLLLAAPAVLAQTQRPASPPAPSAVGRRPGSGKSNDRGGVIPRHTAEPIVIRDSSLKIDVYSTSDNAVITSGDTITVNGEGANQATVLVPTRVVAVAKGKRGAAMPGRLLSQTALAHPMQAVQQYVYRIDAYAKGRFIPFSELAFQFEKFTWRISPRGHNRLTLVGCSAPVALTGAWANHFQSTCEYRSGDLQLRLGNVTIHSAEAGARVVNLSTGCSEFRIEPITHPPHQMPFDHSPCGGVSFSAALRYPRVQIKGVNSVTAIDLSVAKVTGRGGPTKGLHPTAHR